MAITHIRIMEDIKVDNPIDTDAIYYCFNPPISRDEMRERKLEIQKKMEQKEIKRLRHMLRLADMGVKNRLFDELDKFKERYILFNIVAMRGREVVKFCEEFSFVPLFDINPGQIERFASSHGLGQHTSTMQGLINGGQGRPRERCLMLVPLAVYSDMVERSILNNPS